MCILIRCCTPKSVSWNAVLKSKNIGRLPDKEMGLAFLPIEVGMWCWVATKWQTAAHTSSLLPELSKLAMK